MAITFGDAGAPSQKTINLDAVFATSLANARGKLTDNIGSANPFFHKMMKSDLYESYDGGTHIEEPLMYALATMESYDGYDPLSTDTVDGITNGVFPARQLAVPISYSEKERIQNKRNIVPLVKSKIMQSELGIQEGFATDFMDGNGDADIVSAKVNGVNGSLSITPIAGMIDYDPTSAGTVGNIDQSSATNSWWRNKTKASSASTYDDFILELNNITNSTALGAGGMPDLWLMDQVTYELFVHAYFLKYRVTNSADPDFPFENTKFRGGLVVMDEKVPDAANDLTAASLTEGSVYIINSKFMRVRYIPERNFELLLDENGKAFVKPSNQDARIGHIGWMGEVTSNNRRKLGVMGSIARTLTA